MRARELLRRLDGLEVADLTSAALATAIGGLVRDGRLPAGADLPSERDLASALGRSRGTIARAYEQLRADGLAHTRHGAGTTIGCCAGPWASSRAAELEPIVPVVAARPPPLATGAIDLRRTRWQLPPAPGTSGLETAPASGHADGSALVAPVPPLDRVLAELLADQGLEVPAAELIVVDGAVRALDVALATLLRPGEPVLVPALCDPGWLALLRVRGLRPVALPVTADGRADLPGWLRRVRSRPAAVALLSASHAAPAGTVLAAHERRLLVEAAADADVTLVDDLRHGELWTEQPPPPALASYDIDDRTVTIGSTAPGAPPESSLGWVHTSSPPLAARLRAVASTTDAAPPGALLAAAGHVGGQHPALLAQRRQHLIDHTALTIRLVTPAAPEVSVAPAAGGPFRLLHLGGVPGTAVADAARDRGVAVHAGADCAARGSEPSAVVVSLTGRTEELVTGLRVLIEIVRALA
ncbi:MAG: PLP-dependent aminotransferase family protein [Nitriliruptoraceae bacterium]